MKQENNILHDEVSEENRYLPKTEVDGFTFSNVREGKPVTNRDAGILCQTSKHSEKKLYRQGRRIVELPHTRIIVKRFQIWESTLPLMAYSSTHSSENSKIFMAY